MSTLSKKVMEQIKKGQVKPRPRWQFVLWHILFWALFVASIMIGSTVTGMMIHELIMVQWDFVPHLAGYNQFGIFLLPAIWLFSIGLLILLAYQSFLHTKKGYKYRASVVVAVSVIFSVILGTVVYHTKMAENIDSFAGEHFGPYAMVNEHVDSIWMKPGENMIAGEIIELKSDVEWVVEAYDGESWSVFIDDDTKIQDGEYSVGMSIIVAGETAGSDDFNTITADKLGELRRGAKGKGDGSPQDGQGEGPKFERKTQ